LLFIMSLKSVKRGHGRPFSCCELMRISLEKLNEPALLCFLSLENKSNDLK